ncbi:hypothetical protein Forpi1262_v014768 [Fusarium oxysporum f. sp. raphani]|uniref:Uncharacterized protein n=1 Tax=Fusarium oxysporum f. sp. raphani TaxID=96318 RepID=A0A8J5PIF7_FUSOX|nr:hypothetical protein Forpi1262_v014768 [Fusarium oxysporum f. sp. raphani]
MTDKKGSGKADQEMDCSSSAPTELPPSYDITLSQSESQQQDQLQATEDFPTLVLDGTNIYSLYAPNRILYQLSNAPYDATRKIYAIEKLRYRMTNGGSEQKLKHTVDHIYDFRHGISIESYKQITILGQTSRKRTYPNMIMHRCLNGCHTICEGGQVKLTPDYVLKAESPLKDRLNQGKNNTTIWKDEKGEVVAIETKLQRDENEKLYDLLVTSWCAHVWKDAQKDLKEPMSWDKFKRIASTMPNKSAGIYGGAGIGGASLGF